jgi:cytochrome oxidase Cu insertion factor (SCO1/SenC/PrrC family)
VAANLVQAELPARGMSPAELLFDVLRSPLAQALALAIGLGMFLLSFGPALGLRDTFRGASLGFRPAPPFTLPDQRGQSVALEQLTGGPVILTFIHTRCTLACPLTVANVEQAMELLGKDAQTVRLVAITVDPVHDGPAELRGFAERYRLSPAWRLLGGPADAVNQVLAAYHAEPYPVTSEPPHPAGHGATAGPAADGLLHPTMVLLVDSQSVLRYAYGPGFAPADLAHDIRLLQRDMGGPSVPFPLY